MAKVWYHPGTGTYMPVDDCYIVEVPDDIDAEVIEEFLDNWQPE